MLKLTVKQLNDLERFSVLVGTKEKTFSSAVDVLSDSGSQLLFEKIHGMTGAPTNAVAASIYLRRYGFFIAAQLHLMSEHNIIWTGELGDISLVTNSDTILFSIPAKDFRHVQNRGADMRFILERYGHPVVTYFSKRAKISKLILWENIWGYVLWMYSMLLQENSPSAQYDLAVLLEDETWKPALRRSPFKQFIKNQEALDAMANYKRTTCCLYKELPNTEQCPYCPLAK